MGEKTAQALERIAHLLEGEESEGAESEGREDAKEDGVRDRQLSTSTGNGARGHPPTGLPRCGIRARLPGLVVRLTSRPISFRSISPVAALISFLE